MHAATLPELLETERLLLRPVAADDLEFFVELHSRPEVVRFLGGGGKPRTRAATTEWLDVLQREYREHAVGQFAVVDRERGALVGRSGFSFFELRTRAGESLPRATWGLSTGAEDDDARAILEVGYVIHPTAWGQGFATEAAGRWYAHALEERGAPAVSSLIHPDNSASRRVAEKNRLRLTGEVLLDGVRYDWHQLEHAPRCG